MGAPLAFNYNLSYNINMKQAGSLMVKQGTHNSLSGGSIPSRPTIDELRKLGKWPFPQWENGQIVQFKVKTPRVPKPDWFKEAGEAPF